MKHQTRFCVNATLMAVTLVLGALISPAAENELKAGMIGLDTSHVIAFSKVMNDPNAAPDVAGCKVVAAYPKGTEDIEAGLSRVERFTNEIREGGVEIVDSIPTLIGKVDVVMLMTIDGRPHLEQALPVMKAGKPLFIDKPFAGTLTDAIVIVRLAEHYDIPLFSSSSLRYSENAVKVRAGAVGKVVGADVYSPCSLEPSHPDFYWYGVHGCEMLYTVMGTGCEEVVRVQTDGTDVAVGTWAGGRIGVFRGLREGKKDYGGTAFGENGIHPTGPYSGYRPLVVEIVKFFKTGEAPIPIKETIELFAFMEAADESERQGGVPVKMADVMEKAEAEAEKKIKKIIGGE